MTSPPDIPAPRRCSICAAAYTDAAYRPFCSRRCADVDLARWFNGSYVVAGEAESDSADDNPDHELPSENK